MKSLRSWYIYLASGVSLLVLSFQVIGLLQSLLIDYDFESAEATAVQIAAIVVALPFFLVHWTWAQRLTRREADEVLAVPRRLYLYVMLAVFAGVLIGQGSLLVRTLLDAVLNVRRDLYGMPTNTGELVLYALCPLLVATLLWFYHWRVLGEDNRRSTETPAGAVFRQLYTYGFCAAVLLIACINASDLLRILLENWLPTERALTTTVVRRILSADISQFLVSMAAWLLFWRMAQRRFLPPEGVDRQSVIRKIYLYLVVFVAVVTTVSDAAVLLSSLIERWMDVLGAGAGGGLSQALAVMLVGGVVWAYHAVVIGRDAQVAPERGRQALVRRIYRYLAAGVGLAATLVGLGGLLSVLLRGLAAGSWLVDLRQQFAWFSAALIAGLPVWLVHWRQVGTDVAQEGAPGMEERRSFVRSFYLYFYLFVATIAVLVSLVYIVSQLVELVMGERTSASLLVDLGQAIAYSLIGVGVWLYHGAILRQDREMLGAQALQPETALRVWVGSVDPAWQPVLAEALREGFPGVQVLGLAGEGAADRPVSQPDLTQVDFILATWGALAGQAELDVMPAGKPQVVEADTGETAASVTKKVHKILLPLPEEGWDWAGVPTGGAEGVFKAVIREMRRMIDSSQ